MPTQQTILEMEFPADSESDSDDEIVEKNPPKHVLEEPPKKRRKRLDLVQMGSVLTAAGLGSSNRHIAKQMGVGESTIRAIRKRYRDRGNCLRRVGSGRRTYFMGCALFYA